MLRRALVASLGAGLVAGLAISSALAGSIDVVTYHYHNNRSGWNETENQLNWSNVNAASFGLLQSVAVDDQVDAQPLILRAATLAKLGFANFPNDVAYIATENNTLYAIDTITGAVLLSRHLGTPVATSNLPNHCGNNSAVVGINSTPVIDSARGVMYLLAYYWENNAPLYRMHEINLSTLADVVPPVVVSATQTDDQGDSVPFNAVAQRMRAALLLVRGPWAHDVKPPFGHANLEPVIYAAFTSYCDQDANLSRGWVLGFDGVTLNVLPNPTMTDEQSTVDAGSTPKYLSTIWMSGYGIAADPQNNLYVATGNSNQIRTNNYQESALKIDPATNAIVDYFTPSNFATLDKMDGDFGAGGVMVLPDLPRQPHFAVAGGKDGRLFLLNRDNMGGLVVGGPDAPPNVSQGKCYCGESYFVGSDLQPRVVSSGGVNVMTWLVPNSLQGNLSLEATSDAIVGGEQDPGFFTSVSSYYSRKNTAIIWAVSRSVNSAVTLYAFSASSPMQTLYSTTAGAWPHVNGNSNLMPVVNNGRVFVASYKELNIYGLTALSPNRVAMAVDPKAFAPILDDAPGTRYFGVITSVEANNSVFSMQLRTGDALRVDAAPAQASNVGLPLYVGEVVEVRGTKPINGPFSANVLLRAKKSPTTWAADRP